MSGLQYRAAPLPSGAAERCSGSGREFKPKSQRFSFISPPEVYYGRSGQMPSEPKQGELPIKLDSFSCGRRSNRETTGTATEARETGARKCTCLAGKPKHASGRAGRKRVACLAIDAGHDRVLLVSTERREASTFLDAKEAPKLLSRVDFRLLPASRSRLADREGREDLDRAGSFLSTTYSVPLLITAGNEGDVCGAENRVCEPNFDLDERIDRTIAKPRNVCSVKGHVRVEELLGNMSSVECNLNWELVG
ncbi:hypothetical protein KM043_010810 [Ampulex compressa]|nr:hypothetical protein KM043_010810 [Ampulex compressa]